MKERPWSLFDKEKSEDFDETTLPTFRGNHYALVDGICMNCGEDQDEHVYVEHSLRCPRIAR